MKFNVFCFLFLVLLVPSLAFGFTRVDSEEIAANTSWKGEVLVVNPLRVAKGAALTIKPGSVVRFAKGAGLTVSGVLKAEGRKGSVITFTSAEKGPLPGDWSGISFTEAGEGSALRFCRIEYAAAVSVAVCSPAVQNCELLEGVQGLVLARKTASSLKGNAIRDMSGGGIQCQMGSAPVIEGNTIERCGPYGVLSGQESQPTIKGNTVTGCDNGLNISQPVPPVEDNLLKGNKVGILATSGGKALTLRGNRVRDNEKGIFCLQFASPLIEKNEVTGNKEGITCFRASSPWIKGNDISRNDSGISCIQLCNPRITLNDIHDNKRGIYLDLSSYAMISGNNIYANGVQVELGNMSSDWERKINRKPMRGAQAKNLSMAERGKAVLQPVGDASAIMGYVDATGNWWGGSVTEEMEAKGPEADIKGFIDYYDVPTRTYEGYSGVYIQDRINYGGWKKSRIKDAGR